MVSAIPATSSNTSAAPLSNKAKLIIAGVILLLLTLGGIALYIRARNKGREQGSINLSTPVSDNPSGGNQSPGMSNSEIAVLVGDLHADMAGMNFVGHNLTPWQQLQATSDTDFVRVNNEFNMKYQSESGESFREWLESESGNVWFSDVKTVMNKRFSKLNIS